MRVTILKIVKYLLALCLIYFVWVKLSLSLALSLSLVFFFSALALISVATMTYTLVIIYIMSLILLFSCEFQNGKYKISFGIGGMVQYDQIFISPLGCSPCNVLLEVAMTTVGPLLEWKKQKNRKLEERKLWKGFNLWCHDWWFIVISGKNDAPENHKARINRRML